MAYVTKDYPSKRAMMEDIKELNRLTTEANPDHINSLERVKRSLTLYSPGPFPVTQNGTDTVEGPHYPKPHRWYARVVVKEGVVYGAK